MTPDEIAYALQCAADVMSLPWDGAVPQYEMVDRDYLGAAGRSVDRNGRTVMNAPKQTAAYLFSRPGSEGKAYFSRQAAKPQVVHEMGHYLQDRAGIRPQGNLHAVEAQAYEAERLAPFECLTWTGSWKPSIKSAADTKRSDLARALAESRGAAPLVPE